MIFTLVNFGRVGRFFDGWVNGERFKFVSGISKPENILVVLVTAAGKFYWNAKASEIPGSTDLGIPQGVKVSQARHFKWGLKRWVLDRIVNAEYPDVAQVCAAARNIELLHESGPSNKRDMDGNRVQHRGHGNQEYRGRSDQSYRGQHDRRQEQKGQDYRASNRSGNDRQGYQGNNNRQWKDQAARGNQQGRHSGSSSQQKPVEALPPPPLCTTCGKAHPGPCFKATGGCFVCGSTTHKIKDCPKRNSMVPGNYNKPPPTSGRVYSTTREQAERTSGTITGILYIDNHTVFTLFDTGATHSIISGRHSGSSSQEKPVEALPPPPLCTTCGKAHPGPCFKATGGCFVCGSTTHKIKDCPKRNSVVPGNYIKPPPTSGRVYSTTREQAERTSGTITGILYIDNHTVFTLFDTGATHSIISVTFAKKLNMIPTPLTNQLSISTPMKNRMLINHEYVNCPLRFDDRVRPANLLPLDMVDFDVEIGCVHSGSGCGWIAVYGFEGVGLYWIRFGVDPTDFLFYSF
ncbi:reverse transcriptase domain-containing protein [Artemisia annua]|uniref:Reverse transcriptase domain-containing protein n=1 Tax=Artemisia annua TaxID=35608 RepID=A0A2U1NDY0_ARTAN|nr:reverse transcriptase domain-containing protein [Artemisia annua]